MKIKKEDIRKIINSRNPGDINRLITLINDDETPLDLKSLAIWGIGKIKAKNGLPALFHLILYHSNSEIIEKTCWALGEIREKNSIPILKKVLSDPKYSDDLKRMREGCSKTPLGGTNTKSGGWNSIVYAVCKILTGSERVYLENE